MSEVKKPTRRKKTIKIAFTGEVRQDDLLIGSHGNTELRIKGNFQISGIIYCPKYSVTLHIKGSGKISFRGKCDRIIIRRMSGDCTLDLTDVTYKELKCEALQGRSVVIAGNTRAVTPAILSDEATLHVHERLLIFNPVITGKSRILSMSVSGVVEELSPGIVDLEAYEEIQ